ncbi:MAG: cysteine desulfurase [Bacteroidetes bacterium]|nr:cysteine desulfurase [Bacteroidota bacterium]PHX82875.1 MAG: cysteine desulfurase CsdA [Flavobacteriales bacterium]
MNKSNNISELNYDVKKYRSDFPILTREVNGKQLVYFDNGSTTQKPKVVIDSMTDYYTRYNSNIHRGVHHLSQEASTAYENARVTVQKFLNANSANEIILTRGTTESINLVAYSYLRKKLSPGDEILITEMEHHSNILPWQNLCEEMSVVLRVVPVNNNGELEIEYLQKMFSPKTKFFAFTHVSNTLGTINPAKEIIELAHANNIAVLVDGAQAVPHMQVDIQHLNCDFYCFSAHKVYGPTGIGALFVKEDILNNMVPYQTGGGIIKTVSFAKTTYVDGPLKFEAGTPNIEGAVGMAKAMEYITEIGIEKIMQHEHELLVYATSKLNTIDGMQIIGTAKNKAGVISFVVRNIHPFDIGAILDQQGIAVRTGHHCTQPLVEKFGIPGTVRVSFGLYNTKEEVDVFIAALEKTVKMLS